MPTSDAGRDRLRSLAANAALALLAVLLVLLGLEAAFRLAPGLLLPAGSFGAGRRHPELGMNVHGGRVLYNKVRFVERVPNADGFMDVDHAPVPSPGVARIGFFGDSYVESVQVPLEQVFFRLLAAQRPDVETFGFGVSGWGTLHGLRAYETFGPRYRLDAAVYVFVENDLGDNAYEISARAGGLSSGVPYAELDGDGYRLRWLVEPGREPGWYRAAKWLQQTSLLAHVVRDRVAALERGGVQVRLAEESVEMSGAAGTVPGANDLPATWPGPYRARAQQLAGILLTEWQRATAANGARLAVLYVPRGESQLRGELRAEDTWLPWLRETSERLGLPLVDPTAALRARLERGEPVYDDHWTPAGHAVIAAVLADALPALLPPQGGG